METGGFKGRTRVITRDDLYARSSALLGIPADTIVAEYGMTELTSQYYDVNAATRAKSGPPWLRARVVGPDRRTLPNGKTGSLLHVDLANRSSCIAVQTDDLGVREDDGFVLLGREREAEPRGCSLDAEELRERARNVTLWANRRSPEIDRAALVDRLKGGSAVGILPELTKRASRLGEWPGPMIVPSKSAYCAPGSLFFALWRPYS